MQKKYHSQLLKNLVVLSCCLLISCGGGDDGNPLDEGTQDVAPPHVPMNGGPCTTDAEGPEGGLCQISGFSARSFCSYECDYVNDICHLQDLAGGDAGFNATALEAVLNGADQGPHRDALVLGAGLALELAGRAGDLHDGIAQGYAALDSGAAQQVLTQLRAFTA